MSLDFLAERKIAEAVSSGEFDDLPGRGKPLELDDDPLVPEDLRMAYRILRNAGYVPQEVAGSGKGERKLGLLRARVEARYFRRVVRKLGR
ncbi:MAG: DUF1992 domain-containing protein [Betaproteobacteria bacterium]|nr:DUF1992 domain-containing protein [Betaproteobacteria bacterium]